MKNSTRIAVFLSAILISAALCYRAFAFTDVGGETPSGVVKRMLMSESGSLDIGCATAPTLIDLTLTTATTTVTLTATSSAFFAANNSTPTILISFDNVKVLPLWASGTVSFSFPLKIVYFKAETAGTSKLLAAYCQ